MAGVGAAGGMLGLGTISSAQAALLPTPASSQSFDVVVIGSGMAGCAAALEAASAGAKVAVLEKAAESKAGGNSAYSAGIFAMPKDNSDAARSAFLKDFITKAQGRGNQVIYDLLARNARADIDWLRQNGVQFMPEGTMQPYQVATATTAPGTFMGMPRQLKALRDLIIAKGGVFAFDTKAKQLVVDTRGAVVGVRAAGANGLTDYKARAVVIATGGYAGNRRILEAYSDPNAGALMVRGIDWATGDGLMMAKEAGAGLRGMGGIMALHVAAVDPVETAAGNPFAAQPYCLSINREGKRFMDESRGYVAHGKAVLGQPGQSASLIFDETIKALPGPTMNFATFQRLGIKVAEANTLEDLARAIDAPVEPFMATVRAFNAAVEKGAAPGASPPKRVLAHKIETPRFYAFKWLVPGITLTFGGIMINDKAQVLEPDGRAIAGLYAAGEGAGAVYFDDYVGGASLTNCLVMGRIAGRQAMA